MRHTCSEYVQSTNKGYKEMPQWCASHVPVCVFTVRTVHVYDIAGPTNFVLFLEE